MGNVFSPNYHALSAVRSRSAARGSIGRVVVGATLNGPLVPRSVGSADSVPDWSRNGAVVLREFLMSKNG